jgi:hypothetical protein
MIEAPLTTPSKPGVLQPLEFLVVLLAAVIAINSQFHALEEPYVVNGDVFQSIFWMQQFYDSEFFQNDLLTDYSKHLHLTWGFFIVYRILSFIIAH